MNVWILDLNAPRTVTWGTNQEQAGIVLGTVWTWSSRRYLPQRADSLNRPDQHRVGEGAEQPNRVNHVIAANVMLVQWFFSVVEGVELWRDKLNRKESERGHWRAGRIWTIESFLMALHMMTTGMDGIVHVYFIQRILTTPQISNLLSGKSRKIFRGQRCSLKYWKRPLRSRWVGGDELWDCNLAEALQKMSCNWDSVDQKNCVCRLVQGWLLFSLEFWRGSRNQVMTSTDVPVNRTYPRKIKKEKTPSLFSFF